MLIHRNGAAKRWKNRVELAQKGALQNVQIANNFPMKSLQVTSRNEREILAQQESESENEEKKAMNLYNFRRSRADVRRKSERRKGNMEVAQFLSRVVANATQQLQDTLISRTAVPNEANEPEPDPWRGRATAGGSINMACSQNSEIAMNIEEESSSLSLTRAVGDATLQLRDRTKANDTGIPAVEPRGNSIAKRKMTPKRYGNAVGENLNAKNRGAICKPAWRAVGSRLKESILDAQQLDKKRNGRDGISEGDESTTRGKWRATAKNDMNATETRGEAANEKNKRKDGKRKEDRNYDGRRVTKHQKGEAVNRKDLGRMNKRKDGPNKGSGNAVGGNSGKQGNRKNDGPTAGKRSKISGSDVASSRKTSGKDMNEEASGRTKIRNVGYRKGDGDEAGGNSKVTGSRGEFALGMRVGASSKGSIQEKDNRKGSGTENGNEGNIEMRDNSIEGKNKLEPRKKKKTRRNKPGKNAANKRQEAKPYKKTTK